MKQILDILALLTGVAGLFGLIVSIKNFKDARNKSIDDFISKRKQKKHEEN